MGGPGLMPHDCLQIHMYVGTLPPASWGLLEVTEKFPKETGRHVTYQGLCLFGHLTCCDYGMLAQKSSGESWFPVQVVSRTFSFAA